MTACIAVVGSRSRLERARQRQRRSSCSVERPIGAVHAVRVSAEDFKNR